MIIEGDFRVVLRTDGILWINQQDPDGLRRTFDKDAIIRLGRSLIVLGFRSKADSNVNRRSDQSFNKQLVESK